MACSVVQDMFQIQDVKSCKSQLRKVGERNCPEGGEGWAHWGTSVMEADQLLKTGCQLVSRCRRKESLGYIHQQDVNLYRHNEKRKNGESENDRNRAMKTIQICEWGDPERPREQCTKIHGVKVRKKICLLSEENKANFENFMVCFYSCCYCVVLILLCHILGNTTRILHVLCVQSTAESYHQH